MLAVNGVASWSALVIGGLLVVVTYADALATTVVVREGAGPLTRRVVTLAWRVALRVASRGTGSRGLAVGGPALLIGTILVWVALLWAGWSLIFLAGDPAVQSSPDEVPAGWVDIVYFAGFSVFTLGVGDYVATSGGWRLATAVASFSGLFLITLAITYLLSVVSAVVAKRALALHVGGLGPTAHDIVALGWVGDRFSSNFEQHLLALATEVAATAEQHLAYPVLHTFHAPEAATSTPLALAELDDALWLLAHGVAGEIRPDAATLAPLRHGIDRYLVTAGTGGSHRPVDPPPLDLEPLRRAGIPTVGDERFRRAVDDERRGAMARLVADAGWSWRGRRSAG